MIFNKAGRLVKPNTPFMLGDVPIECVNRYTYLGITITPNLNFTYATKSLHTKSIRAFFGLIRTIDRKSLSHKSLCFLFDALIKPIISYGCQSWIDSTNLAHIITPLLNHPDFQFNLDENVLPSSDGGKRILHAIKTIYSDNTEKIHLKYLKWSLGVHKNVTNVCMWGDSGRPPLIVGMLKLATDYYQRLANKNDSSLVSLAFQEQKHNNLSWYKFMNLLTNKIYGPTIEGDIINPNIRISRRISIWLNAEFWTIWSKSLEFYPKLEYYYSLKKEPGREHYLGLSNYNARKALSMLRTSAHKLRIETGRYTGLDRCDRICSYCNSNQIKVIEDEAHLLFDCPQYSDERKKLLLNRSRLKACFSTRDLKAIFDLTDNINSEKETDYVSLLHLGLFAFNSFKIVRKNSEALTNSSSNIS